MAKKKVEAKKTVTEGNITLGEFAEMNNTIQSLVFDNNILKARLDRIVAALSTAKPIKKDY